MKKIKTTKQFKFYNAEELHLCPICGSQVEDWDEICDKCGWEVDGIVYENEKSAANNNLTPKQYRRKWDKNFAIQYENACKQLLNKSLLTIAKLI